MNDVSAMSCSFLDSSDRNSHALYRNVMCFLDVESLCAIVRKSRMAERCRVRQGFVWAKCHIREFYLAGWLDEVPVAGLAALEGRSASTADVAGTDETDGGSVVGKCGLVGAAPSWQVQIRKARLLRSRQSVFVLASQWPR